MTEANKWITSEHVTNCLKRFKDEDELELADAYDNKIEQNKDDIRKLLDLLPLGTAVTFCRNYIDEVLKQED